MDETQNKLKLGKNTPAALQKVKQDIAREATRTNTILGVEVPANDAAVKLVEDLKAQDKFDASSKSRGGKRVVR